MATPAELILLRLLTVDWNRDRSLVELATVYVGGTRTDEELAGLAALEAEWQAAEVGC